MLTAYIPFCCQKTSNVNVTIEDFVISDTRLKCWLMHHKKERQTSQQHVLRHVVQHTFSLIGFSVTHLNQWHTSSSPSHFTKLHFAFRKIHRSFHGSVWRLCHDICSVHDRFSHQHNYMNTEQSSASVWCFSLCVSEKCQCELRVFAHAMLLSLIVCFLEGSETHSHKLQRWCSRQEWHESSWAWCLCRNQWRPRSSMSVWRHQ